MKLSKFIKMLQQMQMPNKDMEVRLSNEFGLSRVSVSRDVCKGMVVIKPDDRINRMNARRRELRRIHKQKELDEFYAKNTVRRSFNVTLRKFPKFGGA